MNQKNKFGIIVSTRSFFPSKLVKTARDAVMRVMDKLGYEYIMVGETDTQYGAVLTFDEAKTCAELFKAHREEICGIVVIMPNFCEELGIAEAIQLADLNVPSIQSVILKSCCKSMELVSKQLIFLRLFSRQCTTTMLKRLWRKSKKFVNTAAFLLGSAMR